MSEDFISLLPYSAPPTTIFVADKLPCHAAIIKKMPIKTLLEELKREAWVENVYVRKQDLVRIKRYKTSDGCYKNDFDEVQFLKWIKTVEDNTAICDMENKKVGKGVFVLPGKKISKGTFIPSSGIIKLDLSKEEFETKNHCSALQDLDSPKKEIVGLIDPEKKGGILDLINHAPDEEELANFKFKKTFPIGNVATANLKGLIKFYQGYAIMGVEAFQDVFGEKQGRQLLWSYAKPDEYLPSHQSTLENSMLVLFDQRSEHNGEIIDANNYSLRRINIFLDAGEPILKKLCSLTRWEIMENSRDSRLNLSLEDSCTTAQAETIRSPIFHSFLQTYLRKNPKADRVIIKI